MSQAYNQILTPLVREYKLFKKDDRSVIPTKIRAICHNAMTD